MCEDWTKEAIVAHKIFKCLIVSCIYCKGQLILGLTSVYADVRENKEYVETWQ
jgi:hypothetical protein